MPVCGLVPFAVDDWPFFFGRDADREIITANLQAARLTLFYGPSGVGKSSVLRAGVDIICANSRSGTSPNWAAGVSGGRVQRLARAGGSGGRLGPRDPADCRPGVAGPGRSGRVGRPLARRSAARLGGTHGRGPAAGPGSIRRVLSVPRQRRTARGRLPSNFRGRELPGSAANFLISIREIPGQVGPLQGRIPKLFDNYLSDRSPGPRSRTGAVVQPLEKFNELHSSRPPTAQKVAWVSRDERSAQESQPTTECRSTRTGRGRVGRRATGKAWIGRRGRGGAEGDESPAAADQRIEAPFLQLVLTRLWDEERRQGSNRLRHATYTALGGASESSARTWTGR